jgi:uncharacterized membrane protein YqgA involved in biofilm formation
MSRSDTTSDPQSSLAARARILQIIIIALAMGIVTVTLTVFVLRGDKPAAPVPSAPVYVFYLFVGTAIATSAVVSRGLEANARRDATRGWPEQGEPTPEQLDAARATLATAYQTRMILRSALVEGPAIFGAIAYFLSGDRTILIVNFALICALVSRFPTATRFEAWINDQLNKAREERLQG